MNIRRLVTKRSCWLRRLFLTQDSGSTEVLLLGDSLTLSCYPVFLSHILRQQGFPVSTRIIAKNGITIGEILSRLEQSGHVYGSADVAVLLIGGNDLKTGILFDAEAFLNILNRIVALLFDCDKKPLILFCTIPVPGPHPALPVDSPHTVRTVLNPLIRETAFQRNLPLCELENIFERHPSLRSDGVHPTVAGDHLLAETIGKHVISNLKSIPGGTP